jgi:RNA recognition motif-containing protein
VIAQGPKSTGKAWVEFANRDDAVKAHRMMNGYMVNGKPITTSLLNQSNIQKQIKREKQRIVQKIIPHQAEIDQVKAKYPQNFALIKDEVPVSFNVSVKPRDPENFPFDLEKLLLRVTLPAEYPIHHMEVDVISSDDEIPLGIKK